MTSSEEKEAFRDSYSYLFSESSEGFWRKSRVLEDLFLLFLFIKRCILHCSWRSFGVSSKLQVLQVVSNIS